MLTFIVLVSVCLLNAFSYATTIESADAADACALGGTCPSLRGRFSALVSGNECWSVHERGVCTRVCLNSLKALQSRRAWAGCARRCGWPKSVLESARDWTAWCESRVEPELPPQPRGGMDVDINAALHKANTSGIVGGTFSGTRGGGARGFPGVIMTIASIILAGLMAAAAISVLLVKYPGSFNKLKKMAENLLRKRGSKTANGILGNSSDRAEMRRLAHGARRHLKAMRSNVD